ncbi:MAG: YbjN domain-containing protein [Alcanivoracaceae bacterium]
MTRYLLGPGLIIAALLMPTQTIASDIVAGNPQQVLDIASGFGSATLETDDVGDPMITGRTNGYKYVIYFYGCEGTDTCSDIQLMASWTDTHANTSHMHQWNFENRFGTAFLDSDGDATIQMSINLAYGVTRENLDDSLDWWRVVVTDFASFVGNIEAPEGRKTQNKEPAI